MTALSEKQKAELNIASKRRYPTDLANLSFAQKRYGYGNTGNLYTIKRGDTLSQLAQTNKTTVSELMKLNPNIQNPDLIYAGKTLNLSGGGSQVPDYSNVNTIADANNAINVNQKTDIQNSTSNGEPPTRKTTSDIMQDIETAVTPQTTKPTGSDFTDTYLGYRSEYGVNDLETQLNDLRAQEQELIAQKQTRVIAERGKTVAMNVIEGRVGQVERQENERIAEVQRGIANTTNQLNTKYNVIETLMKTAEMDYNKASERYDKEMSQNIAMFNSARNIDEANKNEIDKQQDNARSNAQIAINAMNARGVTWQEITPVEQSNLTKLGVESGLGADFFSNMMKVSNGKDIHTSVISPDKTKVTIVFKDGTTKTINTGFTPKPVTSTQDTTQKANFKQIETNLVSVIGEDGFVSPDDYASAKRDWIQAGGVPAEFDTKFKGRRNPKNPYYKVTATSSRSS